MTVPALPYAAQEAMNRLRVNMKFTGQHVQKILILSSVPKEGKSSIAVQLWKMMAEAGFPTVLVDTDLRKSVLKERLQYQYKGEEKGLDYYLSGQADYEEVVYETNIDNGYLVPVSNLLENPLVLLEDARFRTLLEMLSKEYRYVIIDSPPLDSVADGAYLSTLCDGVILVVRSGMTPRSLIRQSLQQLERSESTLLGVVLNRVETQNHAYQKYYGKYGDYYEKKEEE